MQSSFEHWIGTARAASDTLNTVTNDPLDQRFSFLRARCASAVKREQLLYQACLKCRPVDYQGLLAEHRLAFEAGKAALRDYWRAVYGPTSPFPSEAASWQEPAQMTTPVEEGRIHV